MGNRLNITLYTYYSCRAQTRHICTLDSMCSCIRKYGSTLYIGIAMGCTNRNITLYTYIVAEPRQGMRLSSVTDLFEVDRMRM